MLASNPANMVNHISPRRGKQLRISVMGKRSRSVGANVCPSALLSIKVTLLSSVSQSLCKILDRSIIVQCHHEFGQLRIVANLAYWDELHLAVLKPPIFLNGGNVLLCH
jgi:hypothetical protein